MESLNFLTLPMVLHLYLLFIYIAIIFKKNILETEVCLHSQT
jgi:hypothetical protein